MSAGCPRDLAVARPILSQTRRTTQVLSSKSLEKPLRFGGRSATYTECLVGDESGSILLLVQAQQGLSRGPCSHGLLECDRDGVVEVAIG